MIPFRKMHGCGNDFVVLDARATRLPALNWAKLADRRFGIGCDQVIVLELSEQADVLMRIFNADGSEVASCGNASRCVGWLLAQENSKISPVTIQTLAGVIQATVKGESVTVNMGKPRLAWSEIPLAREMDTLHLPLREGPLQDPTAVSMGNPHAVFFVDDVNKVPLDKLGPELEHNTLFPERANIGVAQVISPTEIRLRVWERGAGLTLACGTGACAALVAANLRGLAEHRAQVHLPGGTLVIKWQKNDDHVLMTGEVATTFNGTFNLQDFAA